MEVGEKERERTGRVYNKFIQDYRQCTHDNLRGHIYHFVHNISPFTAPLTTIFHSHFFILFTTSRTALDGLDISMHACTLLIMDGE